MASRVKKTVIKNVTLEAFNQSLANYATADATIAKITADMDKKITAIREKYADQLSDLSETLSTEFEVIQTYCEENPQYFEKKKSMETPYGVVGFRTGTPKLSRRPKFSWASILDLVKHRMPKYIKTKTELNKELIILERDEIGAQVLATVGMEVVQDESFYIDLKKEDTPVI